MEHYRCTLSVDVRDRIRSGTSLQEVLTELGRQLVAATLDSISREYEPEPFAQLLLTLGRDADRPGDPSLNEPAQRYHPGTQRRSQRSGEMRTALSEIEALQREFSFLQFQLPPIDFQLIQPVKTAVGDFKRFSCRADDLVSFEGVRNLNTQSILDGMEREEEDIFPGSMSGSIADSWRSGVTKALERQFAAYTPESVAKNA